MVVRLAVNPTHTSNPHPTFSNNWVIVGTLPHPYEPASSIDEVNVSHYGDIFFDARYNYLYGTPTIMVWGALVGE